MGRRSLAGIVLFLLTSSLAATAPPEGLAPRRPADKLQRLRAPTDVPIDHLVVKFHEGTRVRLRGGVLIALERDDRDRRDLAARGLTEVGVDDDVAEARRLIALEPRVRGAHRLFQQDEDLLAERRRRGEERSGRKLADLDLYYQLRLPDRITASQVEELLAALNGLASVEIAYAEPVPAPASTEPLRWVGAPTHFCQSPDFQSLQGYLNPAPQGVDALYAWTQPSGKGLGVKVVDVEGAWRLTHEDLPSVFYAGGTQNPSLSWRNHGTAVLGEIAGGENSCGVTGIANQAQVGVQSIYGSTVASAISTAATQAGAGGIVLIELHAPGPTPQNPSIPCTCNTLQCYFIAEEYWQANFDAIATATANGTNVVEAAGNGSTDLDHPVYGNLFNRSYRDSGAILVAASLSTSRTPTCWTNWGSRIDVHAWGENVVTTGYGDLHNGGNEDLWYTSQFGGTSSASPIVVGAAASLRAVANARGFGVLTPAQVRQRLNDTGTPQVRGDKHIGPQPDLRGAIDQLQCYALSRTHTGSGADPVASPTSSAGCVTGQYQPGTLIQLTATPAGGFAVGSWSGTHSNASTSTTNSTTMPVSSHAVSVNYVSAPPAGFTAFAHDFESGLSGLTLTGLWHPTTACQAAGSGHSLPTALYFGIDGQCTYENGSAAAGTATLPPIGLKNLATPIHLSFKYFLATEDADGFDLASIEVSANGGPYQVVAGNQPPAGSATLLDPAGAWLSSTADLSPFAGTNVQVRLRFDSVDAFFNDLPGFYVDDVLVAAASCLVAVNLELQNQSISSTATFEACDTIFAGPNLTIEPGANVTLHAGKRVVFRSGFGVKLGATFKAVVP